MKKSLIAFLFVIFAISTVSFAQTEQDIDLIESATSYNFYNFDYVGNGARAKGMGNAFLAVSNDATSGAWNPAGMFEIEKSVISLSYSSLNPSGKSTSLFNSNRITLDHSGAVGEISSFNFVSPLRIKGHPFVFSANLTRNFDNYTNIKYQSGLVQANTVPAGVIVYFDTVAFDVNTEVKSTGGLNSINFGMGTRFYGNVSFGAAVNIYTGRTLYEIFQNLNTDGPTWRVTARQFGTIDQYITIRDTNNFSGTNVTLGFKYNGERTSGALVIRTPFELSENREQAIYKITELNNVVIDDETDTTYRSEILFKYEQPVIIGIGVAHQQSENLLLAFDAEYRPYSGKKIKYRVSQIINPGGNNIEEFLIIDPKWNNAFTFRMGGEYMKEYSFGRVPFRAGFGYVQLPPPNVDLAGNTSKAVNYNYSLGTGIHWEQIMFDLAYTYSTSSNEYSGDELKNKNHHLSFNFTGVF